MLSLRLDAPEAFVDRLVRKGWLRPEDIETRAAISESITDLLLPFGTESSGYTCLYQRCSTEWYDRRKTQAIAALANMGIPR